MASRNALLAVLCLLVLACGRGSPSNPSRLAIAVIPKGTTHEFWKAIRAGADRAGAELGVEVLWKGPLKENDRAAQIQVVQQFVNQKVAGIALAPLDLRALVQPVAAAKDAGIPVVIYDSGLEGAPGKDFVSYVATDNVKGGRLGGEELARLVGPSGKVVLLRYQVGSASTMEREQGFLEVVQRQAGIQILSDNRYAGASAGEAKTQALNMLDVLKAADGVFCSNESATNGMLLALRQEGLAGKIKFVGFDASPPLVEALRNGEIHALVLQDPRDMGHRAVTTLVRHLRGEPVDAKIDTALAVATRANMDDPAIQPLLH